MCTLKCTVYVQYIVEEAGKIVFLKIISKNIRFLCIVRFTVAVYSTVCCTGKLMLYSSVYSTVNIKVYTIQFSNNLHGMKGRVFERLGQLSKPL